MSTSSKVILAIAIVTIVGGGYLLFQGAPQEQVLDTTPVDSQLLIPANSHTKGSVNPKVTIVEFGDFQCPACGAFERVVIKVLPEFKDLVRFVFRHFPLSQHENAMRAALASEAADKQGKFWEMHDLLYEHQDVLSDEAILGYAASLNLDMDKFQKDATSAEAREKVSADLVSGLEFGIRATPTIFINGIKYEGGFSEEDFRSTIQQLLDRI